MFSLHIDTARSWRGGQQQALLTVLGLRALGQRAALVAHPNGELRRRASEGLDLVPLAPLNEMDFGAAWRLSRVIRQLRPEIVHAHDPHGVAMAALALSLGARAVCPRFIASRRVDFQMRGNSFSRWKYRQVDCFIAASEAIRRILLADGVPEDRTVTVHEGIDVERVVQTPVAPVHAEFWLPTRAPIVGHVGALVPHKGQRHLVDAAALVVQEIPDARFLILGEGELRQSIEHQIKEHRLGRHVLLPGFRADVLALHKTFDVFVLSSVSEGLGTSILDAMASARPVVATRVGGIPEVVVDGETGLLVPPRDHHAMAAAIVRLLRDEPWRTRLGQAGLARVRERFTSEQMVRATLAVYEQTAGRTPAADSDRLAARE